MAEYYFVCTDEPPVPCNEEWLISEDLLGCTRCRSVTNARVVNAVAEYAEVMCCITTRTRRVRPKKEIGGYIGLIRNDVRDALGFDAISSIFHVGTPTFKDRTRGELYSTLVIRNALELAYVRSAQPLLVFKCPICQAPIYSYDRRKELYFVTGNMQKLSALYGCRDSSWIVRSDIAQKLKMFKLKCLLIFPLTITDEPPDGLPCDLWDLPPGYLFE